MLSKDGQVYSNNSLLSLSEVFGTANDSHSLMCVSGASVTGHGDWYYQNGTVVPNYGRGFAFYTSKGDDGTVVRLHTRNNNVSLMNTSQFCCELLNMNDLIQKLCVNICDLDCVIMSEQVIETTTITEVTPVTTHQPQSAGQTASTGTTVGYVVMGLAVLLCLAVATAVVVWKCFRFKVKSNQNM